jgi:hypothetical protein
LSPASHQRGWIAAELEATSLLKRAIKGLGEPGASVGPRKVRPMKAMINVATLVIKRTPLVSSSTKAGDWFTRRPSLVPRNFFHNVGLGREIFQRVAYGRI